MILNVSGRTDIVAFYSEWFLNRYKEGFIDVRNPFNQDLVSRIYFEDVDLIFFCTKNPKPILNKLKIIKKPILFHVTLTPYKEDIEPNVPNKKDLIENIKKLSNIIGKENLIIRYDPVFISKRYNLEYHKKMFERVCTLLEGYTERILISFIDDYKNVRNNKAYIKHQELTEKDYEEIGKSFSKSAHSNGMIVHTCFEDRNLCEFGFDEGECLSHELAYILTGKKYKNWTARKEKKCNCVEMVDIGSYNSCKHFCKYCYANYDEKKVIVNTKLHDKNSSLLIGNIKESDIIKRRKK